MKIDRLIGIITILLQKDKATAPELAKRFEVSRRTINRDIEDICKAGIPLITTQGYCGGISIAEGYKIDKSLFTQEEMQTVLAGIKGLDSVSETQTLSKLLEKLSSRGNQVTVDNTIIIDLASYYQSTLTPKIKELKKAIMEQHFVSFMYYYEKGEKHRTIEPYRLIFKWSSWYIYGYAPERDGFRLFKLNRLWNLKTEDAFFEARSLPEREIDFGSVFTSPPHHLKAMFHESEKHRLIDEYGIDCFSVSENGKLLFECNFARYDNMREWIFSFGDKVTILEPENLLTDRLRMAENILKQKSKKGQCTS